MNFQEWTRSILMYFFARTSWWIITLQEKVLDEMQMWLDMNAFRLIRKISRHRFQTARLRLFSCRSWTFFDELLRISGSPTTSEFSESVPATACVRLVPSFLCDHLSFLNCDSCYCILSSTVCKYTPCQQFKSHLLQQTFFRRVRTPLFLLVRPGRWQTLLDYIAHASE